MSTATEWTVLERLLLAQAVNKYGEDSWSQVSRTLKQHPLLQDHTQPETFNQKNCSLQYYLMMEAIDSESAPNDNANLVAQDMPKVVKVARQLYFQRVEELKRIINDDEDRFVTLLAEIDDIKSRTAATTADEQQASPPKVHSDIKPVAENGTIEQEESKGSTDRISTLYDTEMEETGQTPLKDDNDTDSHQLTTTSMDLSPKQNETTSDHADVDTHKFTTKHNDLPATDKVEDESTTIIQRQLDSESVAKLEQPDHRDADSDSIMETPVANETSAPPPSSAVVDDILASEPSPTGTKRSPTDITSPNAGLDQHTMDSSSKRQKLDQSDIPRSPSFSTPAQSVDDQLETNSIEKDISHDQANIEKTPNLTETSEADQAESDRVETRQSPAITSIPVKSPSPSPSPSSTTAAAATEISVAEPSTVSKTGSPTTNIAASETSTNTPVLATETGQGEEEGDNLSVSLKDADGTESVAGSDSNAATPSATTTTTSEKRRSVSSGNIKDDPRQKSWQKNVNLLWREIANHKNGAMFMNPIKEAQAPLYYDVVKYPLDLKTIKNRIRDGVIRTTVEFERDVVLMLTNSLMYNKEGTEIYQMAHEMLQDVTEQIKIFKTADGNSSTHIKGASILAKDRRKSLAE